MNRTSTRVVHDRLRTSERLSRITQREIAKGAGVHQSQVSRILAGNFARISPNVIKICKFARIKLTVEQPASDKLREAVERVWDGSSAQENALVRLILAAGGLTSPPSRES